MKRFIALMLACMLLLLCGCAPDGDAAVENTPMTETTNEPNTKPISKPTAEPTPTAEPAPVYVNPLNGEILDEPYTGRVFAASICNTQNAIPHISLNEADVVMEMFVNNTVIRDFALYSDIRDVEVFGSVRSTRLIFNEIVEHYDAVLIHSGASNLVINDYLKKKLDNLNISSWDLLQAEAGYRDEEYDRSYEVSLFGRGEKIHEYAASQEMKLEQPANKDYGFSFTDEGTPANGEAAKNIEIAFNFEGFVKKTEMKYDAAADKYIYHQYGEDMRDLITDELEMFKNVIIMKTKTSIRDIYHVSEFTDGGEGWFACGGKLIPITWTCDGNFEPFVFFDENGERLQLERGNTYIAIMSDKSGEVLWD